MKKAENGDRWPRVVRAGSASTKVFRIKHHGTKSGVAYVVAWYANGQRKRQKFANQGEALHEARLRADQINSGQVEAAGFSKQDRDELVAARSITGNVPLLAALKEWRRGHNLTAGNIIPACEAWASRNSTAHDRRNVADVTKLYLAAKSKAGIKTADNHGHIFKDITRDFGDRIIDTITARELDAWLARWENPGTRLTFRKWTVALWRWAQKQNFLSREVKTEAEHTETSLIAGNSPAIVQKHYLELVTKSEGEAWFALTPAKAS